MPSFMTIPLELRDLIITHVLLTQRTEAPSLDESFEDLIETRREYESPSLRSWNSLVLYPSTTPPISTATKLLLVNRQLRDETLANVAFLAKSATLDLDIIILDEILPLPTWTYLPFHTLSLDVLNATFRISGSYNPEKERLVDGEYGPYARYDRYKGFRIDETAGPAMSWQIYSILERFIRCGARDDRVSQNEHMHLTIKNLHINIETPPGIDSSRFGPPRSGYWRVDADESHVLDPRRLVDFIRRNIRRLLLGCDDEWFSYGQLLYEHIDRIIIKLDGKVLHMFEMAERLESFGGLRGKYSTGEELRNYKMRARLVRKHRGLIVLEE